MMENGKTPTGNMKTSKPPEGKANFPLRRLLVFPGCFASGRQQNCRPARGMDDILFVNNNQFFILNS